MKLRFKSLEGRIATLFMVLIIAVQMLGLAVIQQGIDSNARASIATELANGEKVFRKLLEQGAQTQRFNAQVLARDTAFVQAIGNGGEDDRATIASALDNSARRARADLAILVDGERRVAVSTVDKPADTLIALVASLLDTADQRGGAVAVAVVEQTPMQIVVMPVKAPVTIAWVVMGFAIDGQLARDMRELSGLDVAILAPEADGSWRPTASTLPASHMPVVAADLRRLSGHLLTPFDLTIDGGKYSARLVPVGRGQDLRGDGVGVLLARSIDAATAQYASLERTLIVLTLIGILVAVVVAVVTAKRIAHPLRELARTARRLERGDYRGEVDVRRNDEIGDLAKAFNSMRDGIAKREREIGRLAYWDSLTGLPNRPQFVRLLDTALAQARDAGHAVFVLMLDLDRFKHVNDVMGHNFGDDLLRQVAHRLREHLAGSGADVQVARLGGDEFTILLPVSSQEHALQVAAGILRSLEVPLSFEDQTVDVGAGLGLAGFPAHGSSVEELLSMAEVAMYQAKQRRDGPVMYEPAMDTASASRLGMLTELRQAIECDELRLHLQPKLRLDTGAVIGAEALVRWVHPERGNVFPDEFIPFAEQTGFIRELTRWVLDRAAAACRQLQEEGIHLKISVNLSTRDLLDPDLPCRFSEILARHGVEARDFCLEITESAIMDDPVRAQATLEALHAMGAELSIDDFGTGYSSLAYLKRLPVDELKIDKSFVMNMEHDIGDTKIVRSTIELGHNMGLRVVAEGIETEAVWRLLATLGCDQGQGYFMSRPLPPAQLGDWIRAWRAPVNTAL